MTPEEARDVRVTKLLAEVVGRLPPLTAEDVAATLAERDRGELIELDDAFAQLAGVDKATWLLKVAQRQEYLSAKPGAAT